MSTACPIENSTQLATSLSDFYDELEPQENFTSEQAEAIGALIEDMFTFGKFSSPQTAELLRSRMQTAFRKFVALAFVMRPAAISTKAVTARQISESLSMTRQGFSLLCVSWSDRLGGLRSGGMKTAEARQNYRSAGGGAVGRTTPRPAHGIIGDAYRDNDMREFQMRTAKGAIAKLNSEGTWSLVEVRTLLTLGWIDEDARLTAEGERIVKEMRTEGDG
jgi:hypothetical protein